MNDFFHKARNLSHGELKTLAKFSSGLLVLVLSVLLVSGALPGYIPRLPLVLHQVNQTAATVLGNVQGVPAPSGVPYTGQTYPADTTCWVNWSYTGYGPNWTPLCPTIGSSAWGESPGGIDTFGTGIFSIDLGGGRGQSVYDTYADQSGYATVATAWVQHATSIPNNLVSLTGSSNGTYLLAVENDGQGYGGSGGVYVSSNSGGSWTKVGPGSEMCAGAVSSTGQYMAVQDCEPHGYVWTSSNYGSSWTAQASSDPNGYGIYSLSMSSDGQRMVEVNPSAAQVFVSVDRGNTWTKVWQGTYAQVSAAYSGDGTKLYILENPGNSNINVLLSTNDGVSFSQIATATGLPPMVFGLSVSSDGSKLAASTDFEGSSPYVSVNGGLTWSARGPSGSIYTLLSSYSAYSSDGSTLIGSFTDSYSGTTKGVLTSRDDGKDWVYWSNTTGLIGPVFSSSNGNFLALGAQNGTDSFGNPVNYVFTLSNYGGYSSSSGFTNNTSGTAPTVTAGTPMTFEWSCLPSRTVNWESKSGQGTFSQGGWGGGQIYTLNFTTSVSGSSSSGGGFSLSTSNLYGSQTVNAPLTAGTYTYTLTCNGGSNAMSIPVTVTNSVNPPTATIVSDATKVGGVPTMTVGSSMHITANYSAGSGDTLTADGINPDTGGNGVDSGNSVPCANISPFNASCWTQPDAQKVYTFSTNTPGSYTFFADAKTADYASYQSVAHVQVNVACQTNYVNQGGSCVCPLFGPDGLTCVAACPAHSTQSGSSCTCSAGYTPSGDSCVLAAQPAALSLSVLKSHVQKNTPASLTWSVTGLPGDGSKTCQITSSPSGVFSASTNGMQTSWSGTNVATGNITQSTVFTLSCTGATPQSVTVGIVPQVQEI